MEALKSIRAKIAFPASIAVTTAAGYAAARSAADASGNPPGKAARVKYFYIFMDNLDQQKNGCCSGLDCTSSPHGQSGPQTLLMDSAQMEVCCGAPPGAPSSPLEKPGYRLLNFVEDFLQTPVGPVPRVKTKLESSDFLGTLTARLGLKRDQYKIAPGLYCVGNPGQDSPVLVTANYKLTFDTLRRELTSFDAWILVLDTRGINVWCAAGKALFSTREVVYRVKHTMLEKLVHHHQIILPQLAATGVAAHQVKKESGFKVIWGPVAAKEIQPFIAQGCNADQSMRQVTFSILERTVLIPVELSHLPKKSAWVLLAIFLISGIGTGFFSISDAWDRGLMAIAAYAGGIAAGAVAVPILLPWIPGRAFALKGALTGMIAGSAVVLIFRGSLIWVEALALVLITVGISSYLAMNFTGSTPYTSLSGVEKEMRKGLFFQIVSAAFVLLFWVCSPFV